MKTKTKSKKNTKIQEGNKKWRRERKQEEEKVDSNLHEGIS